MSGVESAPRTAPGPAIAGGVKPRRWGSWYVAEHRLLVMRAYLQTLIFTGVGSPLIYLFALGIGLGSLVGQVPGASVSYLVFVAPALVVSAALMSGVEEFTFPVMAGFKWIGNFYAMNAAPIAGRQIVNGIVISVSIRLAVASLVYYLILLVFGAVPNVTGILLVPLAALTALSIGMPVMAYAATITEDKGQFALIMRFVITPLFLFSGTFFPLETLPVYLQWIGWISPLWHGTQLGRMVSYGLAEPVWLTIVHVAYPAALAIIGWVLAGRIVTRRLDQ